MPRDDAWLIQGLSQGDPEAVRVFCERYGPMLEKVADKYLAVGLRRRVGPESICQSACMSFLRRAKAGEFQLSDGDDLWRLLCAITLTKVREKARYHLRQKRNINREQSLQAPKGNENEEQYFDPASRQQSPMEALEFQEQFETLMGEFSEEEQLLVDLRLQQFTNDEVAKLMNCSERTVRRILNRVKERLLRLQNEFRFFRRIRG